MLYKYADYDCFVRGSAIKPSILPPAETDMYDTHWVPILAVKGLVIIPANAIKICLCQSANKVVHSGCEGNRRKEAVGLDILPGSLVSVHTTLPDTSQKRCH